jgi:hypothetical protein
MFDVYFVSQGDWLDIFIESASNELSMRADGERSFDSMQALSFVQTFHWIAYRRFLSTRSRKARCVTMKMHQISGGSYFISTQLLFCSVRFEPTKLITFLQNLLSIGVTSPSAAAAMGEPNAHVRGIDALMLEAPIRWPLTIVYSPSTLTQYQIIFRLLLHCKTVMSMLTRCAHPAGCILYIL